MKAAVAGELTGLQANVGEASAALERLRRTADWRAMPWGGALVLLVVALTLGGFWLLTPSRQEMIAFRAERAKLKAAVDALVSRGGRADLKTCGARGEHLCARSISMWARPEKISDTLSLGLSRTRPPKG